MRPKPSVAQRSIKINRDEIEIILTRKMGGVIFELKGEGFNDVRRLFDQPALRRIIEDIDTLGTFNFSGGTVSVDPGHQDELARLLEKFL